MYNLNEHGVNEKKKMSNMDLPWQFCCRLKMGKSSWPSGFR